MAVIWWMRRDLRLSDNMALNEALATGEAVVPLFVADKAILGLKNMGAARLHFCFESVSELDRRLREAGRGYVVIRYSDPLSALCDVAQASGATRVFVNRDYSPLARRRDERVKEGLAEIGVEFLAFKDLLLFEKDEILTKSGATPYKVYGPYARSWLQKEVPEVIGPTWPEIPLLGTPDGISCDSLPSLDELGFELVQDVQAAGESAARARLAQWFDLERDESVAHYAKQRNLPALDEGTSRFSPHLRFGTISPRTLYAAAKQGLLIAQSEQVCQSIETWLGELIWRDFYYQVLYHHPRILNESFIKKYDRLPWLFEEDAFSAWKHGQTGYPYIDAAMRQLRATGWMHNRPRMAVACFLTKNLLHDWRIGYDYFMEMLVDGDPANNNGGWQWAASTGASSQPYFRVFNPISQSKKHDPKGIYIRRWLPELEHVPMRWLHEPWKMSHEQQQKANCIIGQDYPPPIAPHDECRQRAIELYRNA